MKFDRTSASYVALVACAIAFLAFLYLRYGRQPNAGNQPDVLGRMAFELSVWQTIAAIAALVVSAVGVIISMNAALDARDIAAQSRLDAATDRTRLEKEAAAERVRVYREAEQRRIDNHNRLIANAAKIGGTVATACERFAVLYAAGRKPKWGTLTDPTARAQVAQVSLTALGATGTDDPDLVLAVSLLRELVSPSLIIWQGFASDDEQSRTLRDHARKIRTAIAKVQSRRLPDA